MTIASKITVHPFDLSSDSEIDFGVELRNVDVSKITADDFAVIQDALYTYQVVHIKNQSHMTPAEQFHLNKLFSTTTGAMRKCKCPSAPPRSLAAMRCTTGSPNPRKNLSEPARFNMHPILTSGCPNANPSLTVSVSTQKAKN